MNPVLHQGAHTVQYGWIPGVMTLVFIAVFLYWTWYALSRKNRSRFDEAAQMPLVDGDE